jgi:hypothetical protein
MAPSESTKEAIHLSRFLSEVLDQPSTTIIFNDNQGAGQLSKNHVFHNRTKHLDIRHHYIREAVERGEYPGEYPGVSGSIRIRRYSGADARKETHVSQLTNLIKLDPLVQ